MTAPRSPEPETVAARSAAAADNPELDGTDGAHPAWWRGNDAGYAKALADVERLQEETVRLAAVARCAPTASDLAETLCYVRRHKHLNRSSCIASRNEARKIAATLQARYDSAAARAALESK